MNTVNGELIKIGCVYVALIKRTDQYTFVRFKNHDLLRLQFNVDYQMMTMEKHENKKRKHKERNEKLLNIRRMAEQTQRESTVDRRMTVAFLMD